MTSMGRVICAILHKESDRVPQMLLLSMYGAKERQISIQEYFSKLNVVTETPLMMKRKYHNECLYTFSHAAAELEAYGGGAIFYEDGPPNSGDPIIHK